MSESMSGDQSWKTLMSMTLQSVAVALIRYEENRKMRSDTQFFHNRSSWRELRKIQKEGIEEVKELIRCLKSKSKFLLSCATPHDDSEYVVTEDLNSTLKSTKRKISRHTAGALAVNYLNELDSTCAKNMAKTAHSIDQELVPALSEQLRTYEKDLRKLWEKGKILIVAWVSIDARVCHYYKLLEMQKCLDNTDTSGSSSSRDLLQSSNMSIDCWLALTKYSAAVQRFDKTCDLVNKHFRALFLAAKDIEHLRVKIIATSAETASIKLMECWQCNVVACKNASGNAKQIPILLSSNELALGEEISRRVREEESLGNSISSSSRLSESPKNEEIFVDEFSRLMLNPSIPLYLPHIHRSFLCGMENAGIILTSWDPVLIVITRQKIMHFFKLPFGTDIQFSIETGFSNIIGYHSLFFEKDLASLQSSGWEEAKVENIELANLLDNIGLQYLEDKSLSDLRKHVAFTMDLDTFVDPIFSMNLNCCTAQLTPSPIASENLITIIEVIPSPNWFSFWSYSEKRITLKTLSQRDAVDLIALFKVN